MGQGQTAGSGGATPTTGGGGSNPNTKYKSKSSKCSPAKVKSCLRTFLAHLFSHIGLCILIVGYAIVGAALFERLESGYEIEQRDSKFKNWTSTFRKIRRQYVDELWNITEQFNVLYEMNWTSAVEQELRKFEAIVAAAAKRDGYDGTNSAKEADMHWSFSGALLYSVSIITTIGYGNTAPRTASGKILTMFYAVIGVPLMLLWLSNIGTLMANTFKFAYSHACCPSSSRSVQNRRPPSCRSEPSSIQVKYSVSAKTCETLVVQNQQQRQHQDFAGQRSLSRGEQRAALRSLDPAAKQVLMECAEYNVNMDQDERSRRILHQLHSSVVTEAGGTGSNMSGIDEESSDDVESVIDMRAVACAGESDLRNINGGGGSIVGISANGGACRGVEGTPSKIPLLLYKGGEGETGPDLVEVEALEEYHGGGGSDGSISPPARYHHKPLSEQRVPISLVLIFVVIYIMGGAMVFSIWEEWNFLESAYFCFITLSTIGLGDYVPGRSLKSAGTEEGHAQLIVCCLYLVLGLAIIAMSFNLVQEEVAAKVKDIARHIGIIKDNPDH